MVTRVVHISDIEGSWERLRTFVERADGVDFNDDEAIVVDDDTMLVFGGDAVDRGPWSRRVVQTLLSAKEAHVDNVVLLGGNRDINKLRLPRELAGALPKKAKAMPEVWAALQGNQPDLLRWIMSNTMGAQPAFDFRQEELRATGKASGDDDVVQSMLDDLDPPGGLHFRYLRQCQLAYRFHDTLFVHGGFADEALGHVPGRAVVDDLDTWIAALNGFYAQQLACYAEKPVVVERDPDWLPVVLYQAPQRGLGRNPASVVYGRFGSDAWNNPRLPTSSSLRWLRERGIRRVVVGHTPCGDIPAILRSDEGVEIVIADNSRGRVDVGVVVTVTPDAVAIAATTELDDGSRVDVDFCLPRDAESPVGKLTADGRLVKAVLADGRALLFRSDERFEMRQTAVPASTLGPLHTPVDTPATGTDTKL